MEVGVFMVLCQYFSELGHMWQTDGMVPLVETSAGQAVCSTRHLTAFGASLLVPQHAVSFTVHVSDTKSELLMNINEAISCRALPRTFKGSFKDRHLKNHCLFSQRVWKI